MKKRDIIIIAAVLAVALLSIPVVGYFSAQRTTDQAQDFVYIYVGNNLYEAVALTEAKVVHIDQGSGKVNDVEISADGHVYMKDSTCDNQDCVKQGEMTADNIEQRPMRNWVVCLPNEISIELRLHSEEQ